MNDNSNGISCPMMCWLVALLASILLAALLMLLGGLGFIASIFLSLIAFVIGGTLLTIFLCQGSAGPVQAGTAGVAPGSAGATAESAAASASSAPSAEAAPASASTAAAAASGAAVASSASAAEVKSGTTLAGEEELAARKGEWKYEGDGAEEKPKKAPAKKKAAPKKAAAKKAAASGGDVDYDGDGVIEGANEGTRPEALDGPRDGKADDLKKIKGVGPKMEKLCNSLGFYHFDQIASWSKDEVAWVDANLEGFKGRVTRDSWVDQAKLLAAGKETEFSKKVDKGGVY